MKVFVTGATGFVGRHFINKLFNDDRVTKIYALSRKSRYEYLNNGKIEYIAANLLEISSYLEELQNSDVIFHFGAELDSKNQCIFKVNTEATKQIADSVKENGARLIFLSSATVYKTQFKTSYSESKLQAERYIDKKLENYTVIRPFWILGHDSRSYLNFLNYLVKFPIIPIIGSGKTKNQPIHIDECVEFIIRAAFDSEAAGKTFTIAGLEPISYNDLIAYTLHRIGQKRRSVHLPITLCKLLARFTSVLSYDALSDFIEDNTNVQNDIYIYGIKPKDYPTTCDTIIERLNYEKY